MLPLLPSQTHKCVPRNSRINLSARPQSPLLLVLTATRAVLVVDVSLRIVDSFVPSVFHKLVFSLGRRDDVFTCCTSTSRTTLVRVTRLSTNLNTESMCVERFKTVEPLVATKAAILSLCYSWDGNILVDSIVVHGTWHLLCSCMVNPSVLMSRLLMV